jgi:hypothetical protein
MQMYRYIHVMMVSAAVTAGCDEAIEDVVADGPTQLRALNDNGIELNGAAANGTRFNGTRFNGTWFNGAMLLDARFAGSVESKLSGWSLVPGTSLLQATDADGRVYVGEELVGAGLRWLIKDESQGTLDVYMRIAAVTQSQRWPDVYFTDIEVRVGAGAWESLCTDGAGSPTEAIVIPGFFDEETASWHPGEGGELAFACRGTAAGKCLEWGYRVWASHEGEALADHYRACTRMVRADYCGNNVPHTVNGTVIDVSDGLKPPILAPETDWAVEAKWGPDGAVCLNQPRKLMYSREAVVAECQSAGVGALPPCEDDDPEEHAGLLLSQASPS